MFRFAAPEDFHDGIGCCAIVSKRIVVTQYIKYGNLLELQYWLHPVAEPA